jgi:DHA1 family multidrug resistance protein-like MFS transporter
MTWKGQINLLFVIQITIIACLGMSDPYWPLIIHHLNPTIMSKQLQYWSAAVYIIPFLITIISIPIWSRLGDKIGHKKMLLRAGCALILTQILIGVTTSPVLLLGICLIQGVFAGFSAAAQAWSVTMSRPESHSYVIGRMRAATAVGAIIGPFIGGIIANYFGYSAIFFISSIFCSVVVIAIAKYLHETPYKQFIQKTKGLRHINKSLMYLLILICLTQAAKWMSSPFFALYVTQRLSGNTLMVGLLYSCIALTVFLSAPKWGLIIDKKIEQSHWVKRILVVTLLVASFSQYFFAFGSNLYLAILSSLVWGVCIGAISLIPFSLLIRQTHEQYRGSVIGLGNSASKLGNLLGVALGAFLQAETNFTYSFIGIGLLYTALGGLVLWSYTRNQIKKDSKETILIPSSQILSGYKN